MAETKKSKYCSNCRIVKPISEFSVRNRLKDTYNNWCKQCFNEYRRLRRLELAAQQSETSPNGRSAR